jgi:hypothetical protein
MMPKGKWYLSPVFEPEYSECFFAIRCDGREQLVIPPVYEGENCHDNSWHHHNVAPGGYEKDFTTFISGKTE